MAQGGRSGQVQAPFGYNLHHDHPPNELATGSLFSGEEQHAMNNWFNNPNDPAVFDIFNNSGTDGKMDPRHILGMNSTFGHSGTFVDPNASNYQTHSGRNHMHSRSQSQSHVGSLFSPDNEHSAVDHEDVDGATSLIHMSNQGDSNAHFGQWGNLNVIPQPSLADPFGGIHTTPRSPHDLPILSAQTFYPPQHFNQQYQNGWMQAGHLNVNNGTYFDQTQHFAPSANSASRPRFPQGVRFGSDPDMGSGHAFGYTAGIDSSAMERERANGLLHVNGAAQAAAATHALRQHANQRTYEINHAPNGDSHADASMPASPGAQNGGLPMPITPTSVMYHLPQSTANNRHRGGIEEEAQPRKRRKSQAQREDEADYRPEGNVPMPGPKVPKAEVGSDDEEYGYAAPRNPASSKRRRSSGGPSSSNSPMSPAGEGSSARKRSIAKARQNLSEEQKRTNHIISEQKRRNVIRQGYADLDKLVPVLNSGKSGLSRAEQIKETVIYLEQVMRGNERMVERLGLAPDAFEETQSSSVAAY